MKRIIDGIRVNFEREDHVGKISIIRYLISKMESFKDDDWIDECKEVAEHFANVADVEFEVQDNANVILFGDRNLTIKKYYSISNHRYVVFGFDNCDIETSSRLIDILRCFHSFAMRMLI
jgi:hypothetical protein